MYKQKDPQDDRRWQWYTDQHGRQWGATIELATGDPVGTIDLYRDGKPTEAPVMPPPQFIKANSKQNYGKLEIDYTGWKSAKRQAHEDYERRVLGIAQQMYKDGALRAIKEREPALYALAGIPPEPIEPILAAEAGDPWALGLSDVRPAWADKYLPTERPVRRSPTGEDLSFMNAAPQAPAVQQAPINPAPSAEADKTSRAYPVYAKAAGRGQSVWTLSNGSTVVGKREDAEKAEAALKLPESKSVGVHESWGAQ
jgi:hypothetical protein